MPLGAVATATHSVGERVYSLALRSLADTKNTLIMVCVALLGALDRLQERLHLPSTLVKELKRKLAKMIDTSSDKAQKFGPKGKQVGERLAESDMWDHTEPEEVRGVVQWAIAVVRYLNHLMVASTLSVCRGIFILIMRVPGVSTACALFYRVLQLVEDTVRFSTTTILEMASAEVGSSNGTDSSGSRGFHHSHHRHRPENYIGDPSMTAVVLEYREKECMVPSNIDQRIRRVMHFSIPLRSFEATVRLPPSHFHESPSTDQLTTVGRPANNSDSSSAFTTSLSSSSPRSIPVSPRARRRVQLAFSNFSDEVLYQARDRLRLERAATLTGTRSLLVPVFNPHDCNEEIRLSCGRHCATKLGPGMHRSVRGSIPFPRNRLVYFEMSLQEVRSPNRSVPMASRIPESRSTAGIGGDAGSGTAPDASVCIGVSTQSMPLNSLVGTSRYSVGFYSAGRILVGGTRRSFVAVNRGFGIQSTVGVLVKVVDQEGTGQTEPTNARGGSSSSGLSLAISPLTRTVSASLWFTVDGVALRDANNQPLEFTLPFPSHSDLFPTLTLHSQGVQVFGRFSAPDIVALDPDLKVSDSEEIWCLDGQRLVRPP